MVITANEIEEQNATPEVHGVIDCDVHSVMPSAKKLQSYLPERWREHVATFGSGGFPGRNYPRRSLGAARRDSFPPAGGPAGSDLGFMVEQHLEPFGVRYAVLGPAVFGNTARIPELALAVAQGINNWTVAEWCEVDSRFRGSVVIPYEQPVLAATEIDRMGPDPRFVQVYMNIGTTRPIGNPYYWPIYEAAVRNGLPVGVHFGGGGGNPGTGAGYPSFYLEDHTGNSQSFQSQLTSLVLEGVFDRFPELKVILIEGGVAWVPPLAWRLDRAFDRLHTEVPHLKRRPSEYIKDQVWMTTQPIEEPAKPSDLAKVIESFPALEKRLLFSSDYPHWDYDAPDIAIRRVQLAEEVEQQIMHGNAEELFDLSGVAS